MPEFEDFQKISEGEIKPIMRIYPRFVSDAERARRMSSEFIDPNEVFATKGDFNALGGTTHTTEAEADLASERYLQGPEGFLTQQPVEEELPQE